MPTSDADLIASHARVTPDKTAVVDDRPGGESTVYTYAGLDRRAERIADLLRELGVTPATRVAWCAQNSAELLAAIGAIRKVGAVAVPMGYQLTPAEAGSILHDSDVSVAWVDAERAGLLERAGRDAPTLRHLLIQDANDEAGPRVAGVAGDRATPPPAADEGIRGGDIYYTSGTTGRPKGAVRRPADPAKSVLIGLIGFRYDDVYLTTGPLYHSGPARFLGMAQALGNTVVVQHRFAADDWLRLVDTHRVSATFSAPTPLRMVCDLPAAEKARYDRSSMRRFVGNAAPWSQALKRAYLADFPPDSLWEVYGAAELGVATALAPDDQLRRPGSCGRPIPGVDVALYDDAGERITAPDVRGDVYVRSPTMFQTYCKATALYEADRRGDYHTVGDVGYWDADGYLYIADRKKDVIISGGVNVYPAEVEAVLDESPDVREAAVFGVPDDRWGERVCAAVVPSRGGVTGAEVLDFARARLAGYKLPRRIEFLDDLPRTGSGKVLRRALRDRYAGEGAAC
jgi:acyl-CoA synthetase (AMP-forming)/AMP-acid ligase II